MRTTLDLALTRWSVVSRKWHELSSNSAPVLGAFLAGWYWRDMGNAMPLRSEIGTFCDSFRVGFREADDWNAILEGEEHQRAIDAKHAGIPNNPES